MASVKEKAVKKIAQTKKFDLSTFKAGKNLLQTSKFKIQEYLHISPAFEEALSIPGIPCGHITLLRGHSDTSKTTALVLVAMAAQKAQKLPVFIITEMKWSWEHAKTMGFEVHEKINKETGEVSYDGDFIYIDRSSLGSIEDVAGFIADIIDEQTNGNIPLDIVFLWDSAGSIPGEQSIQSKKNNNMWNAGAMSTQFGNFINQRIMMSRKTDSPYTNTLVVVNKVRVEYPMGNNPKEQPKLKNKAGDALFWDATFVITFGGVKGPGTMKLKAKRGDKQVEWAKVVRVSCDKNHQTGIQTSGTIVTTIHGFIKNEPREIEAYKKKYSPEWAKILGHGEIEYVEEQDTSTVQQTEEDD